MKLFLLMMLPIFFMASSEIYSNNRYNLLAEQFGSGSGMPHHPVFNESQNSFHKTIQEALNSASPGDVIRLSAGTYTESLKIRRSVTILGPNDMISPNDISRPRLPEAVLLPQGGADALKLLSDKINLTVKGVTIDMSGSHPNDRYIFLGNKNSGAGLVFENNVFQNSQIIGTRGSASWFFDRVSFNLKLHNNLFRYNAPSNGIYIHDTALGSNIANINITHNVWENNGAWAMNLNNVHGSILGNVIKNNDFSAKQWEGRKAYASDSDWPGQFGIVLANHNNNLVIKNNKFSDLEGPGIRIWRSFKGDLWVLGNEFHNNRIAAVNVNPVDWDGSLDDIVFRDNSFNGNEMALDNPVLTDLDARYNHWIATTGPFHAVRNIFGEGDPVSDNVIFEPWWYDETLNELSPVRIYYTASDHNNSDAGLVDQAKTTDGALFHHSSRDYNESELVYENFDAQLKIYPNPVRHGRLNIDFKGNYKGNASIFIYDLHGSVIKQNLLTGKTSHHKIDVSGIPAGIYYLQVTVDQTVYVERFVVAN